MIGVKLSYGNYLFIIISRNCSKTEELPELTLNSTHAEDSRLPSDESLQTSLLTNNLDFSTNLFDDRMPNLDISGSSKSDNEFNPYSLGFKDDIGLVNASIDFEIGTDTCVSKEVSVASILSGKKSDPQNV